MDTRGAIFISIMLLSIFTFLVFKRFDNDDASLSKNDTAEQQEIIHNQEQHRVFLEIRTVEVRKEIQREQEAIKRREKHRKIREYKERLKKEIIPKAVIEELQEEAGQILLELAKKHAVQCNGHYYYFDKELDASDYDIAKISAFGKEYEHHDMSKKRVKALEVDARDYLTVKITVKNIEWFGKFLNRRARRLKINNWIRTPHKISKYNAHLYRVLIKHTFRINAQTRQLEEIPIKYGILSDRKEYHIEPWFAYFPRSTRELDEKCHDIPLIAKQD